MLDRAKEFKNFSQDGLELTIDTKTGEVYASQSAIARMCQKGESTIRYFIASQSIPVLNTQVLTNSGVQRAALLNEEGIRRCLNKFNTTAKLEALSYFKLPSLKRTKNPAGSVKQQVYLIGDLTRGVCKIGISTNVKRRLKDIQCGYPYPLVILATLKGTFELEHSLHYQFKRYQLQSEWFTIEPTIFKAFNLQISDFLRVHLDIITLGTYGERLMLIKKLEDYACINSVELEDLDTLIAKVAHAADLYQIKYTTI